MNRKYGNIATWEVKNRLVRLLVGGGWRRFGCCSLQPHISPTVLSGTVLEVDLEVFRSC